MALRKVTRRFVLALAVLFGIGIVGVILSAVLGGCEQPPPSPKHIEYGTLLGLSPNERASKLGAAVGEGCVGERAYYAGRISDSGTEVWSVACRNGKNYDVMIGTAAGENTMATDCAQMDAAKLPRRCFQELKGQ